MFCGRIVHFEVPDSANPMHIGEAERRVSPLNKVVNGLGITGQSPSSRLRRGAATKTPQVGADTCGVWGESPPILREIFAFFSRARVPPQCGPQLSSRRREEG